MHSDPQDSPPSAPEPQRPDPRRRRLPSGGLTPGRVVVVYGLMGVIGAGVTWLVWERSPLVWPEATERMVAWQAAALGAGVGLAVVALDALLERVIPALRDMGQAFRELLGAGMTPQRALLYASLSAIGEEILFRGLLQPWLGLVASSLIFGLMHFPPDRRLLIWPVFAAAMGFAFGGLFLYTGDLLAPIVAHFTINTFGFLRMMPPQRAR